MTPWLWQFIGAGSVFLFWSFPLGTVLFVSIRTELSPSYVCTVTRFVGVWGVFLCPDGYVWVGLLLWKSFDSDADVVIAFCEVNSNFITLAASVIQRLETNLYLIAQYILKYVWASLKVIPVTRGEAVLVLSLWLEGHAFDLQSSTLPQCCDTNPHQLTRIF